MNLDRKKHVLLAVFVLSGIGGLIYESIWSHYLKLFLGHAAYAQSLVLAIFMGGMGLGAWLAGRYSTRIKNLLLAYAGIELAIGLTAMVFHAVFVSFVNLSYEKILPALSDPFLAELFRWGGSGLLILPQSILLGMTFPFMSGALIRLFPQNSGPILSSLYFTNSLGAAAGVLLSGFVLIAAVGLPGTIMTAGLINVLVALFAWALSKGLPPTEPIAANTGTSIDTGSVAAASARNGRKLLLIVAFLTGCASFIYEIIWIRMLSMVLGSSNHAFEIMLCAFILGLAFGSLFIKRRFATMRNHRLWLAIIQIVMGVLAVGSLILYNSSMDAMQVVMQALAKTEQGYAAFNLASLVITIGIMFPAAFCAGMTLPLITEILFREGQGERSIGSVYAANTFGSIIGVILAVHVGLPLLGIKGGLLAGGAIDVIAGLLLLRGVRDTSEGSPTRTLNPFAVAASVLVAFGLVYAYVQPDALKMASGIYRFGKFVPSDSATVLLEKDGKTATVHALSEYGILTLRTNGKTDASLRTGPGDPTTDEFTQILAGVLGLYHRPNSEYVANIGIGSGITTHSLLSSPNVREVHTIEIEQFMTDGARQFGKASERTFDDPRSKIFIDDAKSFLAVSPRRYDIIVSEPSNPWVSGVSSLFTQEFYARMKSRLKPDGLFVQWLQIYDLDYDLVAAVMKSLGAEFGDYVIYETNRTDLAIIASPTKIGPPNADIFKHAAATTMLERLNVRTPGDLDMRRIGNKRLLQPYFDSFGATRNSDYFPILDLRATKDRFLGKNAIPISELHSFAIPVLDMLQGSSPAPGSPQIMDIDRLASPRVRDAVVARQMAEYLDDGMLKGKTALTDAFAYEMEHVRTYWLNCSAATAGQARLDPMLRLAQFANPGLHTQELATLWGKFRGSRCYAALSPTHRAWVDLFSHVGQRNAEGMVASTKMLSDLPPLVSDSKIDYQPQLEYRQVSLVTALLALGRKEEAAQAWQQIMVSKSERFRRTPMAMIIDGQVAR
jgi:predicted membrane-bound spermidine synthase